MRTGGAGREVAVDSRESRERRTWRCLGKSGGGAFGC
jgi:hypothetical protein